MTHTFDPPSAPDPDSGRDAPPVLELSGVDVVYDGRPALRDVTVRLAERRVGVIGANGSGKSTLARLFNGLVLPDRGRVRVEGLDTAEDPRAVRSRVGFVFQNPENQIVFPIVAEDMAFGLRNLGVPKRRVPERVTEALEGFGIGHLAERQSHLLSGGEKQLVALAAVLVMRPDVVVFDEPTTLLDLRNRNRIRDTIARMPQTAVVVTHDLELVSDFDRVLVVDEGRIVCDGDPATAVARYREMCS